MNTGTVPEQTGMALTKAFCGAQNALNDLSASTRIKEDTPTELHISMDTKQTKRPRIDHM